MGCPPGKLGEIVPFTGKDAFTTDGFECQPDTADSRKQVNEPEIAAWRCSAPEIQQTLKLRNDVPRWLAFSIAPAEKGPGRNAEMPGHIEGRPGGLGGGEIPDGGIVVDCGEHGSPAGIF